MSKEMGKNIGTGLLILFVILNWEFILALIILALMIALYWIVKIMFF